MGAFFPPECRNQLLALTCMGNFLHCRFTEVPVFSGTLTFAPGHSKLDGHRT
jgi:hypothetical protein